MQETQVQNFSVHVRYNGRSYEFDADRLDIGQLNTDAEILAIVGRELDGNLNGYVVDREPNGNMTIRPQAVFGVAAVEGKTMAFENTVHPSELTRRELFRAINNLLEFDRSDNPLNGWSAECTSILQDCPWTAVSVRLKRPTYQSELPFAKVGFSKVCWPDEWNSDFGIELATIKAVQKLAKEVYDYYRQED